MIDTTFPTAVRDQLQAIRIRRCIFAALRALMIGLTVLMSTMLLAMLTDWALTLFDTRWRVLLTSASLLLSVFVLVRTGWKPIRRALGWSSAAKDVDLFVPQLEERWRTIAGFAESGRQLEDPMSQAMLDRVRHESVAMNRLVRPERIVSPRILRRPLLVLTGALLSLVVFFASHWGQTSVLWERFWSPLTHISATQIASRTGDLIAPRGTTVEVIATLSGLQRASAELVLRSPDTPDLEQSLTAVPSAAEGSSAGTVQFSVDVDESLEYCVVAGDGRTEWHSITAIDYPELKDVQLTVTPPKYVDEPPIEKSLIPGRLRAVQGSQLELAVRPQVGLESFSLQIAIPVSGSESAVASVSSTADPEAAKLAALGIPQESVETVVLHRGVDGWYRFDTALVEDFSITPLLVSEHGLENQKPRVCRIEVVEDHAPVARIVGPGGDGSAAADELLEIRFEAHDDHGIASAELIIYEHTPESGSDSRILEVRQIPLGDQLLNRHVMGKTELNLKELGLPEGTTISYAVRVTDNRHVDPDAAAAGQMIADRDSAGSQEPADPSVPSRSADTNHVDDGTMGDSAQPSADAGAKSLTETENPVGAETTNAANTAAVAKAESVTSGDKTTAVDGGLTPSKSAPGGSKSDTESPKSDADLATEMLAADRSDGRKSDRNSETEPDPAAGNLVDQTTEQSSAQNAGSAQTAANDSANKNANLDATASAVPAANRQASDGSSEALASAPGSEANENPTEAENSASPRQFRDTDSSTGTKADDTKAAEFRADDTKEPASVPVGQATPPLDSSDASRTVSERPPGEVTAVGEQAGNLSAESNAGAKNQGSQGAQSVRADVASIGSRTGGQNTEPRPSVRLKLNPQQIESGQRQETARRQLKITSRLEAVAKSDDPRRDRTKPIREKVVQIDAMLNVVEANLTALCRHETDETQRAGGFRDVDQRLKAVEEFVAELDQETRETIFEFVGLQMVDISSNHVTPARDAVFLAIRRPDSGADVPAEEALHHVISARELLQALLRRYDSVAQEQQLAEQMKDAVKMYTVYVERAQRLMREARQNRDPFRVQREMAVVEVDQAYLDRLAEVTRMRRDMMTELARILADDPRLRSRYLDLIRRRRSSLGNQLAELLARQDQSAQEVLGWLSVDANQRDNYWIQISDVRLDVPNVLAKEAQQLSDRVEKQLPLVLDPGVGAAAVAITTAKQISLDARRCDLNVREFRKSGDNSAEVLSLSKSAETLEFRIRELAAALDRLQFEGESLDGVEEYVQRRRIEVQALADQAGHWSAVAQAVEHRFFGELASLDQDQILIETEILRNEMRGIQDDLAGQFNDEVPMPPEIAGLANDLHRVMESITHNQVAAVFALSTERIEAAAAQQEMALQRFEEAQKILNQLRKKTTETLDSITEPNPNIADLRDPTLDQFLADLEREPNIEAQLGIPNRPRNIRILQDALAWNQNGAALLGSSGEAAATRIQDMIRQRLEPQNSNSPNNEQTAAKDSKQPADPQKLSEEERRQLAESQEMQKMLQERMAQAQQELERQAQDSSHSEAERRQLAAMAAQMRQSLQNMQNGQTPEQLWRQMVEADQAKAVLEALAKGENIPDEQWNKLMSTLGDGLAQVNGRVPSEDFRRAIEQYQDQIRKLTGE